MNIGIYIKSLRMSRGLSQEELGKLVGVQRAAVQKWESGMTQNLKRSTIQKLAEYFDVSPALFVSDSVPKKTGYLYKSGNVTTKTKKVPIIGEIACGQPIFCNQEYDAYIEVDVNMDIDFCLKAHGDSMINARIFDGDLVFIRKQPDVDNGEIAAVIIDDEATLKRVYKYNGRIELRAENPLYAPMNYENEQLEQINILGKAILFQGMVR